MFFGNTHTNALSNYDTTINSGSSTCNGMELNRTSYWVPAMFDGQGNARIPDRMLVYYKSYGGAVGKTEVYPPNMQMVSGNALATSKQPMIGTYAESRKVVFRCGTAQETNNTFDTIPSCPPEKTLEMNINFQTCWNGQDPSNYKVNLAFPSIGPNSGACPSTHPRFMPQMEYRIFFLDHGSDTNTWYLASDVSSTDKKTINPNGRGYSNHADWFGGWHKDINKLWIDNCNNKVLSDCDNGVLGDPRQMTNPKALKKRPEYTGPTIISGQKIYTELCSGAPLSQPSMVAYCPKGATLSHTTAH